MDKKPVYTVIFRVGGTHRFRWAQASIRTESWTDAAVEARHLERQGYRAQAVSVDSLRHGLPQTYEPGEAVEDYERHPDGYFHRRKVS